MGADIDYERASKSPDHNYNIRLTRRDKTSIGAAIFIERIAGEFGYNVSICYGNYDNIISVNAVGKNELKNKDIFLSLMRGVIDAEYDKNY